MTSLFFKHHPHPSKTLTKFLLLLTILIGYFAYLSWKFDVETGGWVAALSWSFFVLCTPVADAGFLLDSPIRLVTGIKMIVTEIIVWVLAISINTATIWINPEIYQTTFLTKIFHDILVTPFPFWSIIILCFMGTFLSIHFGDEIYNSIANHTDKNNPISNKKSRLRMVGMILLFIMIFGLYFLLLQQLGINLPDKL